MRGQVVTIDKKSSQIVNSYYLNKIGKVPNDLNGCQTFQLDPLNGDYISKVAVIATS